MTMFNSYVKLPEGRNGDIMWIIKLKRWCCNLTVTSLERCFSRRIIPLGTLYHVGEASERLHTFPAVFYLPLVFPDDFPTIGWRFQHINLSKGVWTRWLKHQDRWILWSFNGEKVLRNWTGPMLPEWSALGSLLFQYLFGWCGINPPNMQWFSIFGLIFSTYFSTSSKIWGERQGLHSDFIHNGLGRDPKIVQYVLIFNVPSGI